MALFDTYLDYPTYYSILFLCIMRLQSVEMCKILIVFLSATVYFIVFRCFFNMSVISVIFLQIRDYRGLERQHCPSTFRLWCSKCHCIMGTSELSNIPLDFADWLSTSSHLLQPFKKITVRPRYFCGVIMSVPFILFLPLPSNS